MNGRDADNHVDSLGVINHGPGMFVVILQKRIVQFVDDVVVLLCGVNTTKEQHPFEEN